MDLSEYPITRMAESKPKEEDYFALATLTVGGMEIRDVPSKLYLPERVTGSPRIALRPSDDCLDYIVCSHEGSFHAQLNNFDGSVAALIAASIVYFNGAVTRHWGPNLAESTLEAEPRDLVVTQFLSSVSKEPTSIVFWLSPNKMLSPFIISTSSYTGDRTLKRGRQIEIELSPEVKLRFDKHFQSSTTEKGDFLQWSNLVAESSIAHAANDIESVRSLILPKYDDLLLIASLGSRTRTACVGWQAADGRSVTKYFRRDIWIPNGFSLPSFNHGLVSLADFGEFLHVGYSSFGALEDPQPVRQAIYAVIPGRSRTLEEDFLSLFSGLEELILDFRRRANLEWVLSSSDWLILRDHLKEAVKNCPGLSLSSDQRARIYAKMGELNRIPLRVAFDKFCENYRVGLDDLWDVFSTAAGPSLYNIRNRLTHGESLPLEAYEALSVATEHLRWTLERILLSVLGWSVARSEVNRDFLARNATGITLLPRERKRLGDLLAATGA
jgi:hypothetical protein